MITNTSSDHSVFKHLFGALMQLNLYKNMCRQDYSWILTEKHFPVFHYCCNSTYVQGPKIK